MLYWKQVICISTVSLLYKGTASAPSSFLSSCPLSHVPKEGLQLFGRKLHCWTLQLITHLPHSRRWGGGDKSDGTWIPLWSLTVRPWNFTISKGKYSSNHDFCRGYVKLCGRTVDGPVLQTLDGRNVQFTGCRFEASSTSRSKLVLSCFCFSGVDTHPHDWEIFSDDSFLVHMKSQTASTILE